MCDESGGPRRDYQAEHEPDGRTEQAVLENEPDQSISLGAKRRPNPYLACTGRHSPHGHAEDPHRREKARTLRLQSLPLPLEVIVLGVSRLYATFPPNVQHILQIGAVLGITPLVIGFANPLSQHAPVLRKDASVGGIESQVVDLKRIVLEIVELQLAFPPKTDAARPPS